MDKDFNKPSSKEELARQIARNMAMKNDDDVFSSDIGFYADENRSQNAQQSGGTAVKTKKAASDTAEENTSHKKSTSKNKKKKKSSGAKKAGIAIAAILIIALGSGAGLYLHGMKGVQGKFLANTYINGIDVSGKTQKEAYDLVMQDSIIPEKITVTKLDGSEFTIPLSKIGYQDNIKVTIAQYYSQQNHYMWFKYMYTTTQYNFASSFTYDKSLLESELKRKITDSPGTSEPQDAYIEKTDDGFTIVKEVKGDKIDEDKIQQVIDYVEGNVDSGEYAVDISGLNCYQEPSVCSEDLQAEVEKLNSLYDMEINYDFTYTTETLKGSQIMDWITFDADPADGYTVDADKAMEYVDYMADKYDTYGKDRKFKSTSRGEITVKAGQGCYGWWIDKQKTCDQLVELIESGDSANIEPIYYVNPDSSYSYTCNPEWRTAETDIGNTYCEVDLAKQHFWYYKDGKLAYECDIVSGMPTEERNTPGGVYKVWYKEKDKVLRGSLSTGETWETPVTYWNNISTFGVGLHDATWHPYFGGDRYKLYGSHGCINMPLEAAKYVYEKIDLGTPVVMYW